jgi:general secretion pathway protein G
MRKRNSGQAGVTLIEMMVVVTIIALFAALVLPKMLKQGDRARITQTHAQINAFMTALGSYKLDTGVFPTTEQGLNALRVKPEGLTTWQGPYLQKDVENDS